MGPLQSNSTICKRTNQVRVLLPNGGVGGKGQTLNKDDNIMHALSHFQYSIIGVLAHWVHHLAFLNQGSGLK